MNEDYVDANILLRLLTGDEPQKQRASLRLFQAVRDGQLILHTPDTTIADVIYVLTSKRHYNLARADAAAMLAPLVRLRGFKVKHRKAVLRALDLFAATPGLDFGDALILAFMEQERRPTVYSYDTDFDRFPFAQRQEP
jgi:predicted nucleic acid-binding protein